MRGRDGVDIEIIGGTGARQRRRRSSTPTSTRSPSASCSSCRSSPPSSAGPEEIIADAQGAPGDRPARRGRRGQGVLGPRHPRGRAGDDAEADRRRDARRRRRRGAVPGRRHLAGGRQLRDGQRHARRRGGRRGAAPPATRRAAGLAGYERRLERHVRAARPPQAAPGARARAVRPRPAPLPAARRRRRRGDVPRRQPATRSPGCAGSSPQRAQARSASAGATSPATPSTGWRTFG